MTTSRRHLGCAAPVLAALVLVSCSRGESAGPKPARVVPSSGIEGAATAVRIEGEGLSPFVYTDFADGDASRIASRFVLRLGPHSLRDVRADGEGLAAVVPPDVPPGWYDLLVIDPDGRRGTLERAFRVTAAADTGELVAGYRFDTVPPQLARTPFEVTITAVDASGSVVTGFGGSVALSDLTGTVVPLRAGLFASGRCTGTVEVRTARAGDVLTATDDRGRSGSSVPFDVAPAPARRVAFRSAPLTAGAGACSGTVELELQDAFGVATVADATTAVGIAPSSPISLFADGACTEPVTAATIAAGQGSATFHFRATRAGALTLTASAAALDASAQVETIVPGAPDRIAFATAAQTVNAGACSQEVVLELRDAYGNAALGAATLAVSEATATGLTFYSDRNCKVAASAVSVAAGASRGSFWFSGTKAQVVTVLAQGSGLLDATQDEIVEPEGRASRLVFVTPPRTATAGRCSSDPMTIQTADSFGNPVSSAGAVLVSLSASGLSGVRLFADMACTVPITVVAITAGQSLADVWYSGTLSGVATVTARASSLTPASQDVTVVAASPGAIAFTTVPQSVTAGTCSGAVRLELRDAFGNASAAATAVSISLAAAPPEGFALYSDATCATPATAVTVASGTDEARFWFRGTKAQDVDVTAGSAGLGGATQRETIRPGPPAALALLGSAQTIKAGNCSAAIRVEIHDSSGNATPAVASTSVALASSPSGLSFFSDAACSAPAGPLTIAAGATHATFFFSGGTAGDYNVTASAAALQPGTQAETVVPAAPDRVAFGSAPQSVVAGVCSAAVVLQPRDRFGNVSAPTSAVAIGLAASAAGTSLYAGTGCSGTAITSITLAASATTATISFRATVAGPLDITASPAGLAGAMQRETVVPANADHVAFATPARTVTSGQCSPALTLEARDAFGNPSPLLAAETVSFDVSPASATFLFFSDSRCTAGITTASIAAGSSATGFFFRDTVAESRTLTASTSSLGSASQTALVVASGAVTLAYKTAPTPLAAGSCSAVYTLEGRDGYGNAAPVASGTVVALAGGGLPLYSNSACTTPATSTTFVANPNTATFYASGTAVGTYSVTASTTGLDPATATVSVVAATADRLAFTSPPATVAAGACSGPVTLETRDAYGNRSPVTSNRTVSVATSGTAISMYAGGSCAGTPTTSFSLASGSADLTVSFSGTVPGTVTLTATGSGLSGPAAIQTETVQPAPASKLVVVSGGGQTVQAGACSGPVVLESRDAYDNVSAVPAGAVIDLAATPATGFSFHAAAGCSGAAVASVQLAPGATRTTFWFAGTASGSVSVAPTSAGFVAPAPVTETITPAAPDHLAFVTDPQTLVAGACSALAQVEARDRFGNPSAPAGGTQVTLSSAPSSGFAFFSDSACTAAITSTSFASGQVRASFHFKGTAVGTFAATAAAAGLTGTATQDEIVRPGPAASLAWDAIASPQPAGTAFAVGITARDAFGNLATSFTGQANLAVSAGAVSVECRSSCTGTSGTDAFIEGVWTGSVTVKPGALNVVLHAVSGTAAGDSNPFNVQDPVGRSPPLARISASPVVVLEGGTVAFDASASTDYETPQAELEVSWDFEGDQSSPSSAAAPPNAPWTAPFSTAKTASHTYAAAGAYVVRVAVKDTEYRTGGPDVGYATVTVVVLPASTANLCVVTTNIQIDDGASSCAGPYGTDGMLSLAEAVRLTKSMTGTGTITFSGPMTISGGSYSLTRPLNVVAPPGVVLDKLRLSIEADVLLAGMELARSGQLAVAAGSALALRDVWMHDSRTVDVQGSLDLERVRVSACRTGSNATECVRLSSSQALLSMSHSEFRGAGASVLSGNVAVDIVQHATESSSPLRPRIDSTVFTGFGTAVQTASGQQGPVVAYCTFDRNGTAVAGPGRRLVSNAITGSTGTAVVAGNCTNGSYANRENQIVSGNASLGCISGDSGNLAADPLYVFPSAYDHRIDWASPARDTGQSNWIDQQGSLFDLDGPGPGLYFGTSADRGGRETW